MRNNGNGSVLLFSQAEKEFNMLQKLKGQNTLQG